MSKETSNMFDFALNEVSEQSDSTGYRLLGIFKNYFR